MTSGGPFKDQLSSSSPPPEEMDVEAGRNGVNGDNNNYEKYENDEEEVYEDDPFDIGNTKNAPVESLKRWRQAALVLNATRRFRYTLDLKKDEERERRRRMIRAHAQVVRAAMLFKLAGEQDIGVLGPSISLPRSTGDFGIGVEQLTSMTGDNNSTALEQYGGVKGLEGMLNTNLETGVPGEENDTAKRRDTFGSNTYPTKKGKRFLAFLWESWQDLTLIILIIAAIVSLVLGIKTEGLKEGWYDGGSIVFAVLLVIVVTATSDYRQSLQFQNLNEEKRNIQLEVHKDKKSPFLLVGCKVADGFGNMLVTSVGINTEWGLLMNSISEDTGGETPLQVEWCGYFHRHSWALCCSCRACCLVGPIFQWSHKKCGGRS